MKYLLLLFILASCNTQTPEIIKGDGTGKTSDTNNSSNNGPTTETLILAPQDKVGIKPFEQLYRSLRYAINLNDQEGYGGIIETYQKNLTQLPEEYSLTGFTTPHNLSIIAISSALCFEMMWYRPSQFDFSPPGVAFMYVAPKDLSAEHRQIFAQKIVNSLASIYFSDELKAQKVQEHLELFNDLITDGPDDEADTTRHAAFGVCTALLASANNYVM